MKPFRDRTDAGRLLVGPLGVYANRKDVLVLALPEAECRLRTESRAA